MQANYIRPMCSTRLLLRKVGQRAACKYRPKQRSRAQGDVGGGEGGYAIARPTVGEPARLAGAGKTRAAVIGELRQTASDGTPVKTGEVDQFAETHLAGTPRSRADVRAEAIEFAGNPYDALLVHGP